MKKNRLPAFLCIVLLFLTFSLQAQTSHSASFEHGGITRSYHYYVPATYSPSQPTALVLGLHGLGSSGQNFAQYRDFRPIADTANFIFVYPDGSTLLGVRFWNYGNVMGSTVDDIDFLEALVDTISAHYSIDENRVYCTGMSNGAFMAYALACNSSKFAAIAAVTGSMSLNMYNNCQPQLPIPVMHIHGTEDSTNPYDGTSTMKSIPDVISYWVNINQCNPTPLYTLRPDTDPNDNAVAEQYVYHNGINGHSVEHFKIVGGGHTWPGQQMSGGGNLCMDIDGRIEIWRFFNQFQRSAPLSLSEEQPIPFQIYPNPTKSILYIESPNTQPYQIQILDMLGRKIPIAIEHSPQQVNMRQWDKGIYFLEIKQGENRQILKIMLVE